MNGPRRSFGLFLSHQSAYISLRKHFLLPYTFYRLNTLSIPPRTQIPQQFLSFSSVAIHAESVTPLSTPKFDLNSPILAKDALETIINSLSSSLKASKAMIAENIQRPWEGKCQLRDILKVIELFRNLSPSQRSQILSKLLQELPRCEQTAPFSLHDLCHSIASLRYISPNTDQLDNLIEILNRELLTKVSVSQLNHHDTNSLGLAVSGLCNLSSGNPHVLSLLSTLSNALESSLAVESVNIGNPIMDIDIVCRALSGLENCDSDSPAVRKIVKLLADQLREPFRTGRSLQSVENNTRDIDSMGEVLTGKQIQAAARGLKGLSSSHSECRALIGSLAGRLQSMWGTKDKLREPLTNHAAVTILSNLGNMELTEPVVKKLLQRTLSHLKRSESVKGLTPSDISKILSGLQRMSASDVVLQQLLDQLLLNRRTDIRWRPVDISLALSGLKCMNATSGEMKRLLFMLNSEIESIQSKRRKTKNRSEISDTESSFTLNMITEAFLGLKSMSSGAHEVQLLVFSLSEELKLILQDNTSVPPDAIHSVGLILGSLSNMCSHHESIRTLLKIIAISLPKLDPPKSLHQEEWFADLLFGLKFMDSDHYEVRSVVRGLLPHLRFTLEQKTLTFRPISLIKMLSGLRGLSNDAFSGIIYSDGSGVGGRGGHVQRGEPICDLLKICIDCVERCQSIFNLSKVCGALYGLQSMQSGPLNHPAYDPDLIRLLDTLISRSSFEEVISVRDCCQALYGLLDIADSSSEAVLNMKSSLFKKLATFNRQFDREEFIEVERIMKFYAMRPSWLVSPTIALHVRDLQQILHDQSTSNTSLAILAPETTATTKKKIVKISELESSFFQDLTQLFGMDLRLLGCSVSSPPTDSLAPPIRLLRTMNPSLSYKLKNNEIIHGFESDFILRVYKRNPENESTQHSLVGVINIEIDGPSHMPRHKQRFASLRDRYLRELYRQELPHLLFEIYRIKIPDTRGDFSRPKRKSLLSEVVFSDLVPKIEQRFGRAEDER